MQNLHELFLPGEHRAASTQRDDWVRRIKRFDVLPGAKTGTSNYRHIRDCSYLLTMALSPLAILHLVLAAAVPG